MENEPPKPDEPEEEFFGSPRHFHYPKPLPISDEENARRKEIGDRIIEMLKQTKGRRSRWRPRE